MNALNLISYDPHVTFAENCKRPALSTFKKIDELKTTRKVANIALVILLSITLLVSSPLYLLGALLQRKVVQKSPSPPSMKTIPFSEYKQTENSKKIQGILYQQLNVLDQLLCKYHIRYWACGGTLLGVLRHFGIIPWDEDIDIQIHPDDADKLFDPQFQKEAKKYGFDVMEYWDSKSKCYGVFTFSCVPEKNPSVGKNIENYNGKDHSIVRIRTTPNIDLFLSERNEGKITYKGAWAKGLWPNVWFPVTSIDQLHRVKFGPIEIFIPPEEACRTYLTRHYGKDWETTGYTDRYNHITRENSNEKIKIDIGNNAGVCGEYILDPNFLKPTEKI